jgi:TonB family protein
MSTERPSRHRPLDGSPELVWPPSEADIEAIQVIDLGPVQPSVAQPFTHVVEGQSPERQSLIVESLTPRPPSAIVSTQSAFPAQPSAALEVASVVANQARAQGTLRYWRGLCALGLGLMLLEMSVFHAPDSLPERNRSALPERNTSPDPVTVPDLVRARDPDRASPQHAPLPAVDQPLAPMQPAAGTKAAVTRAATLRPMRSAGSRRHPRHHVIGSLSQPRGQRVSSVECDTRAADELNVGPGPTRGLCASEMSTPAELVPPRPIDDWRPRRVPAPFPSPRGAQTSLELVIDEAGRVASARVASSGAAHYDAALLAAARGWRFEPARVAGRPTRATVIMGVPVSP